MAKIGAWWMRKQEALEGEEVQWSTLANRFRGSRSVGGKLFLTQSRLLFNPQHIDATFGGKPWQVALADVQEVTKEPKGSGKASRLGGGLLSDRLRLVLRDGSEELFAVKKLDEVIEQLDAATRSARQP